MFESLRIPFHERVLAAVFIECPELFEVGRTLKPSKHRNRWSAAWVRQVHL